MTAALFVPGGVGACPPARLRPPAPSPAVLTGPSRAVGLPGRGLAPLVPGWASIENCDVQRRRGTRDEATSAVCRGRGRGVPAGIPALTRNEVFVVTAPRPTSRPSRATYRGDVELVPLARRTRPGRRPRSRGLLGALAVFARAVEHVVLTLKVAAVAALVGMTLAAVLVDLTTPEPAQQRVVDGFTPEPSPDISDAPEGLPAKNDRPGHPERTGD